MMEDPHAEVTEALLRQFAPLNQLQDFQLQLLQGALHVQSVRAKTVLFNQGEQDEFDYFLVQGAVELVARDGKVRIIEAGTTAANFPLAHLRPRQYTAKAKTDLQYFVIKSVAYNELISHWSNEGKAELHEFADISLHSETGRLLASFEDDLVSGKFTLPSLPEIAVRLKERLEDESADLGAIAKMVSSEMAVATRLIQAANSPLYRSVVPCSSIQKAIMRLGIKTTRQLVLSLFMRQVFQSNIPVLKKAMHDVWMHSLEVASISCVLARHLKAFSVEEALLAGLIHDLGVVVVLSYAHNYPGMIADEAKLMATVDGLRAHAGAMVLRHWNFSDTMTMVAQESEQWMRDPSPEADLCDLVIVAQLHYFLGKPAHKARPHTMYDVPAFRKLSHSEFTPDTSRQILVEAREMLVEISNLFF